MSSQIVYGQESTTAERLGLSILGNFMDVKIEEIYNNYSAFFPVKASVKKLLNGIPEEYLVFKQISFFSKKYRAVDNKLFAHQVKINLFKY